MRKNIRMFVIIAVSLVTLVILYNKIFGSKYVNMQKDKNSNVKTSTTSEELNIGNSDTLEAIKLEFSTKYDKPIENYIVNVTSDNGKYAKGTINERTSVGGGVWFAAKTNNGWELVFTGNGIITCDIVEKYDFPKDIVTGCVDTNNNNVFVQR
jgi:hypothetical protein